MFGLDANDGLAFLIGVALGLASRLLAFDTPPSEPEQRAVSKLYVFCLAMTPALNAYRFSGLFQALAVANLIVTCAAVAWVLILGRLAGRRVWAQTSVKSPVLTIALVCTGLTYLVWILQDGHLWDFSWLTLGKLLFAIFALLGWLAGACIPAILRVCRLTP